MPSALERVHQVARRDKGAKFTALAYHVTLERLREAYLAIKREAAPRVDGVTWEKYGQHLGENLRRLPARLRSASYRARPSRRAYIRRRRLRLLGVAALEDKIVQSAVVGVLNAILSTEASKVKERCNRGCCVTENHSSTHRNPVTRRFSVFFSKIHCLLMRPLDTVRLFLCISNYGRLS